MAAVTTRQVAPEPAADAKAHAVVVANGSAEYDGGPRIDWARAGKLKVQALSGEQVAMSDIWAKKRTIIVFLRRFGCQTCLSYIVLFAHLKPILASSNTRLVFLTCHEDLSELQVFLTNFAFWLRTLNKGVKDDPGTQTLVEDAEKDPLEEASGGALPGELYLDTEREVYRAFGFMSDIPRSQNRNMYLWTMFMYMTGRLKNSRKITGWKSAYVESMKSLYVLAAKINRYPKDSRIWQQSPGIVAIDREKLLYRFIMKDQKSPLPDINDPKLGQALMCEKPELELLDSAVTRGLEDFVNVLRDPVGVGGRVKANELPMKQKLGSGRESEVFKSRWMGVDVAVKYFRYADADADDEDTTSAADDPVQSFANECAILMGLRHKNIITMMGFGVKPPDSYFLITEFMPRGSLFDVIGNMALSMTPDRKRQMLLDTARGMAFLHGCRPTVIHQDLKSLNLLVAADWTCKVADFGIAKARQENPAERAMAEGLAAEAAAEDEAKPESEEEGPLAGGTIQWMPPEQLKGSTATTTKMDVFAFGVILWEVGMRRRPWRGVPIRTICDSVIAGRRLAYPPTWDEQYQKLVECCWSQDPGVRPPFAKIVKILEKIDIPISS
ncbi:hypothetical protein HK101_004067 [Irineochytrium annulatum]|nr:hypothetical protein HK101_004067 [Irineochytrium annulatum]